MIVCFNKMKTPICSQKYKDFKHRTEYHEIQKYYLNITTMVLPGF